MTIVGLPSQSQLFEEVDRQFAEAHPDAPVPLDEYDSGQAEFVQARAELRERVAGEWANAAFVEHFPEVGFFDPQDPANAQLLDYWLDFRDQILHSASPRYDWSVAMTVEVHGNDAPEPDAPDAAQAPYPNADSPWVDDAGHVAAPGEMAVDDVDAWDMSDEVLGNGIFDFEIGVLDMWERAAGKFHATMLASADAEGEADFAGTIVDHFKEKALGQLVDETVKLIPYGSEIKEVVDKVLGEAERASKASGSAAIRRFYLQHIDLVGDTLQQLRSMKPSFMAAIENTAKNASTSTEAHEHYVWMHGYLRYLFLDAQMRHNANNEDSFFRLMTESWLQGGVYTPDRFDPGSYVVIRIELDFRVRNAELRGPSAQKLAEQLVLNQPGGVDVFSLNLPRRIVQYDGDGMVAVVRLDADDNMTSEQSGTDGDYHGLWKQIQGLPAGWSVTTALTGSG